MKKVFIFVVCGAKEHIDTLHFSIDYLKCFSKQEIWVLTDSSRNEIPVSHESVIDIKTPEELDHHQASIYLKTGIYKFVPKGNMYCYLDTDIIAFSDGVNLIFDEYVPPITFAPDHCRVKKFSPYALNCGCKEDWEKDRALFDGALNKYDKNRQIKDTRIQKEAKELQLVFDELKQSKLKKVRTAARYVLSYPRFKLNNSFSFDRKNRVWQNQSGETVMYEVDIKSIEKETGLKYNRLFGKWLNNSKEDIWKDECDHLGEAISIKFEIGRKIGNWQHWNGGVFLFSDDSHSFLEFWHTHTIEAFSDPYWKTRDQGTLIATVWKFGLEGHPTLDRKWNLIADYYNPYLKWIDDQVLRIDKDLHIRPELVHVYHHFEDNNWEFWRQLIANAERNRKNCK